MRHLNEFDEFNPDDFTEDSLDKDASGIKKLGYHPLKFSIDYVGKYAGCGEAEEEVVKQWEFTPPEGAKTWVSEASGFVNDENIIVKFIFNTGKIFYFARLFRNGQDVIVLKTGEEAKYVPEDDYFFAEVEEFGTLAGVMLTEYYEKYHDKLYKG